MNRPPFDLSRADRDGIAVLAVSGDVDVDTAEPLREQLTGLLSERDAVVDLSGVLFVDSTGLGVLVRGYREARGSGHRMAIAGTPQRVLDIFELTQLTTLFALFPDVDAALESFARR